MSTPVYEIGRDEESFSTVPWGRLNDKGNEDDKLLALSDPAWRMWGCGLIYCQNKLTDGFIPEHAINTFGVRATNKKKVAVELCTPLVAGKGPLWHKVDGGYQVHDYLDWNPSREEVLADRKRGRDRVEKYRSGLRNGGGNGVCNGVGNALQEPHNDDCNAVCHDGSHVPGTTDPQVPRTTDPPVPRTTDPGSGSVQAAASPRIAPDQKTERPNVELITAIVKKEVLPLGLPDSDLPDVTKELCRRYGIPHDSQAVRKAIDSAQFRANRFPMMKANARLA
jgi:hypothetical protein